MLRRKLKRRKGKSVKLKSQHDVEEMRDAGKLVADCFALLHDSIKPGVRLFELDRRVESLILKYGATPLYKGYQGTEEDHPPFPSVICASINEEICHAPASDRRLRKGDIIGIDIGLVYKGWCGDACVTYPVGTIDPETDKLLRVTKESMDVGIEACQIGRRLGEVGVAIEKHAKASGFSVVKEWGGHGLGRNLHEGPSVPHTGPKKQGLRIRPGMVFTIEPMVNMGAADCMLVEEDGWTVVTKDGSLSAQFEHTIAITKDGPVVLSPWHKTMSDFPYI